MLNQVKSSGEQTPIPGSARASTPLSRSLAVPSSTNATPVKKGTSSTLPPRSSGNTTPPATLLLGGTSNVANDTPANPTAGKLKAPPPAAKVVKNFMNPHAERDAQLERDACIQHHQRDRVVRPPVVEALDDKELHELDAMAAALRGVQWQDKLPSVREFLAASSQPRQLQQLASSSLFQAVPKGASSSMRLAASFHVLDEVDLHWVPYAGLVEPLLLAEGQPLSSAAVTAKASSSSHHLRPSPLPLVVQRRISLSNRNAKVLYQSGAVRRGAVGPFRWHYVDETSEGVLPPAQPVEDESTLDPILDFILVNDDTAEEDAESMVPLALQHLVEPDDPQTIPSQFDAEDRDLHTKYGKRNLLSFSLLRLSLCHEEELQLVANQHKTGVASLSSAAVVPRKRDSSALIDSPRSAYILLKNGQQLSELKKEPRNFQSRSVQHHLLRKQTAKERRDIAELEEDEADQNNNSPTKNRSLSPPQLNKRSDEDPSEARKLRVLDELQKQYKELCKRCSQKDMVLCLLGIPRRGLSSGGSERLKGGAGATLLFPLPSSRGEGGGGGGTPHRLAPLNHNSTITSPERPVSSSCVSTALASTYPSGPSPLSKHSQQHNNFAGTAAFASPTQTAVLSSLQKDRSRQARMERKKREDLAVMWGQMHASTLERAMREERAAAQVAEALEDKRRKARRDTPGGGGGLSHSSVNRNSPHPQRDGATVRSCDSNGGTPARHHPNHHNTSDNEGGEDGNLSLSRPSRTSQQTTYSNNLAQAAPSSPSSSPTVSASSPPRVGHNDRHRRNNDDPSMAMLSPVERVRRMYAEKEAARIQELEEGLRRKSEAVARAQLANEQRQRERREECARRAADVREKCEKVKRVADFNTYLLLCQLEQSTGAVETQQRRREELNQGIQAVLHEDHRHSVQAREAFETATVLLQKTMHEEECRTATMMEQYKQQHHSASQSSLNHSSSKLLEDGNRTRSGGGRRPSDGGASNALPSSKTPLNRGLLPTSPAHSERLLPLLHDELDELNEEDEEALEEAAKERQRLADEVEKRAKLLNCRRKKKRRVPTGVDDQQLMDDTRHSLVRLLASTTK